jgi:hypothetical protein
MPVESNGFISALNVSYPDGSVDAVNTLDNYMRTFKYAVLYSFPNIGGAVTATHTELNFVDGVTSAIQTQIDTKGAIAGQTWTGSHVFPTTTTGVTQTLGTANTRYATTEFVSLAVATVTSPGFSATTTAINKTLANLERCLLTATGLTITLPASPANGSIVSIMTNSTAISTTVGRNGSTIMALAEDMTIPLANASVTLLYVNSDWRLF